LEKREQGLAAQSQRTVIESSPALEPLACGAHQTLQKPKGWVRGIQAAKPPAECGGIGHAIGIFDSGCRGFPGTAFQEATLQRLAAGDQAVVSVRRREQGQKGERLPTQVANTAPNSDPIVVFVMSLLVPAAVTDDGILGTNGAAAKDDFGACLGPIGFEVVSRGRKWDKENRDSRRVPLGQLTLPRSEPEAQPSPPQQKPQLEKKKNSSFGGPPSGRAV